MLLHKLPDHLESSLPPELQVFREWYFSNFDADNARKKQDDPVQR